MDNKGEIIGLIGLDDKECRLCLRKLSDRKIQIVEYNDVLRSLMRPGEEGYRQIINYFGEDFLYKNSLINEKKLNKFMAENANKKRIFSVMMEPIFFNYLQSFGDKRKGQIIVVVMPVLQNKKYEQRFTSIVRTSEKE